MLWISLALAQQRSATIEGTDGRVFVDDRWTDRSGEHRLYVALDSATVDAATGAGDAGIGGCFDAMQAAVLADGETWIYAEPVGPGLTALGALGQRSQEAPTEARRLVRIP